MKKAARSPEHLAALSRANKGKIISAETRRKISLAKTGTTHAVSDETRAKLSAAGKRNGFPREAQLKAWALNTGRPHTAATRQKMSATHKKRFEDPENRAKRSVAAALGWARKGATP